MKWTHAAHPVAKALRAAALKYPETVEDMPWGHPAYKVAGKKAFMFVGGDESTGLTVSMKLPFRAAEAPVTNLRRRPAMAWASPAG
jgi:hypothetical protein